MSETANIDDTRTDSRESMDGMEDDEKGGFRGKDGEGKFGRKNAKYKRKYVSSVLTKPYLQVLITNE